MTLNDSHPVDNLLRRYLDHKSGDEQAQKLANRILEQVNMKPVVKYGQKKIFRKAIWFIGMAAAVLLAFFGGLYLSPVQASPEAVVKAAMFAHALPVDRLYLVETTLDPRNPISRLPNANIPRRNYLWTRGDSFWLEPAQAVKNWAMGRNESEELWLALKSGKGLGIRVPLNEVPEAVRLTADLMTMRIETLLNEVLADFTLIEEKAPTGTHLILAKPKLNHHAEKIRSILLEVDSSTRIVRKVVVDRVQKSRPVALVTFTLIETSVQPGGVYQLEGHLNDESMIVEGMENPALIPILLRFFQNKGETKGKSL